MNWATLPSTQRASPMSPWSWSATTPPAVPTWRMTGTAPPRAAASRCPAPCPATAAKAATAKPSTLYQEQLIKQVYAANPKTVVILVSSFPFAINWTQANIPAILHMTHASQDEGTALAKVLFGDYNPGGHLVETWPKSLDQLPPMMDYNIRDGRTYMYFKGEPLYPFGFGLSYTTFKFSNLTNQFAAQSPKTEP